MNTRLTRVITTSLFATVFTVGAGFISTSSALADSAVLGVTQISAVQTFATADNTFANGWKWVFDVTVPTNETVLNMKFADWASTLGNIPAGSNIQIYSAQSSNAFDKEHAITITAAGAYSDPMYLLTTDLDSTKAGKQIQVTVEARVPIGSAGASYSTSYGIQSNPATLSSIAITTAPTKLAYTVGDTLDLAGLVVTGTNSDATTQVETVIASDVTGFDNSTVGTQTLTVTVSGKTATFDVTVAAAPDIIPPTATVTHDESAKTITYTFDEPVQLTNNDGTAINGTIASKLAVYAVTNSDYTTASKVDGVEITGAAVSGNVWTLTYTGTLVDQKNVKYVVDAWGYKIADFAGNKMLPAESAMFTVTGVDTISPKVTSVIATTPGTIVYNFDEAVQLMNADKTAVIASDAYASSLGIYNFNEYAAHVVGSPAPKTYGTIKNAVLSNDNKTLTITYTGSLVKQVDTAYVVDAWGLNITDAAGNKVAQSENQKFTITGDSQAPTVTSVVASTPGIIVYSFDEAVQLTDKNDLVIASGDIANKLAIYGADPVTGNYGLDTKTSNTITSAILSGNVLTINYSGSLIKNANASYVVDAWGYKITDLVGNRMVPALNQIFTVNGDITAPTVIAPVTTTENTIVYNFDEPVQLRDASGVEILPANYATSLGIYNFNEYAAHVVGSPAPKTYGTIKNAVLSNGDKTLTVTYTGSLINHDDTSYIVDAWGLNITDVVGNKMLPNADTQSFIIRGDLTAPTATVTHDESAKTITYSFSEPVQLRDAKGNVLDSSTYVSNLAVYDSSVYLAHIPGDTEPAHAVKISSAILSGDAKSIVITYTGSLIKNTNTSYVVDAWGKNITDLVGNKMAQDAGQIFEVTGDTTAPTVVSVNGSVAGTITYTFSEPVQLIKQDTLAVTTLDKSLLGIYDLTAYVAHQIGQSAPATTGSITNATLSGNVLTITYTGSLIKNADTTYLVDAWGYNITDLVGNKIVQDPTTQSFVVTGDTIPPTAIITPNETAKTITYTFSEPVQLTDAGGNVITNYAFNLTIYDAASYVAFVKYGTEPTKITSANITDATLNGNVLTITYSGSLVKEADASYVIDAWGKNITDMVGNKMVGDDSVVFIIPGDITPPTVKSVTTGTNTITYNFSEPVQLRDSSNVVISLTDYASKLGIYNLADYLGRATYTDAPSKIADITNAVLSNDGLSLSITYTGSLTKQENTDYIVDAWGSNITDAVGNKMVGDPSTQKFTITGDSQAPTATVTAHDESAKTIAYNFSEPVQLTNNDGTAITGDIASKLAVYAVTGSDYGTATKASVTIDSANLVSNVLTIHYTGTLVDQTNVKYVVDAWGYKIADLAGNKMLPTESAMFTVLSASQLITFADNINGGEISAVVITGSSPKYKIVASDKYYISDVLDNSTSVIGSIGFAWESASTTASYTFTNVNSAHTLSAEFSKNNPQ